MSSKFEASKIFVFNHRVPLKVLTKSDTNFGPFACTVQKINPRGIFFAQKGPFSILIPTYIHLQMNFEQKCTAALEW